LASADALIVQWSHNMKSTAFYAIFS